MQGLNASSFYPWANSNPQSMSYDYHNNLASTLQHPPSTSFGLSHAPVDGNFFGSVGSNLAPKVIEQNFPRFGADQYDPLSDGMDPLSNSSQKVDDFSKLEFTSNYDSAMLMIGGENKLTKDDEQPVDAEVGSVENESRTDPGDDLNMTAGEIEIDEMQSKESISNKHFKVAVASFVKEVLKLSWRQGNMSKEAFKTIVKKTVDKVSGAMKGRHAPKSKAKVDQYIDSQQRKLTKLVTGYLDKYVNQ